MSGGAFEYLCWKDGRDLAEHWEDSDNNNLANMIEYLRTIDADDIADELYDMQLTLRSALRRADMVMQRNKDILHAVEWYQSADWSFESVTKAIAARRHPEPEEE